MGCHALTHEISDGIHGYLQCHVNNSHIHHTRQEGKKKKKTELQLFPIRPDLMQRKRKIRK